MNFSVFILYTDTLLNSLINSNAFFFSPSVLNLLGIESHHQQGKKVCLHSPKAYMGSFIFSFHLPDG